MNTKRVKLIAEEEAPRIIPKKLINSDRYDVINNLSGEKNIGIELGVAQGDFSKKMIQSKKFNKFYGVDTYSDTHDINEYKFALKNIGIEKNYHLLRMTFNEAYDLFDDNYFDFIYIDGYAHTGEDGGETIIKWYKKLKIGGIISGDDYHDDWPLVKWAVNDFIKQSNLQLLVTDKTELKGFSKYPSWFAQKENHSTEFTVSQNLKRLSVQEKRRIDKKRYWRVKIRNIERYFKRSNNASEK